MASSHSYEAIILLNGPFYTPWFLAGLLRARNNSWIKQQNNGKAFLERDLSRRGPRAPARRDGASPRDVRARERRSGRQTITRRGRPWQRFTRRPEFLTVISLTLLYAEHLPAVTFSDYMYATTRHKALIHPPAPRRCWHRKGNNIFLGDVPPGAPRTFISSMIYIPLIWGGLQTCFVIDY